MFRMTAIPALSALLTFGSCSKSDDDDAALIASFMVSNGFSGTINAIAPLVDGDVYVGGAFLAFGSTPAFRLIRLNANGKVDTGFDTGTGFDGEVRSLLPIAGGDLIVAGSFTSYNGTNSER